MSFIIARLSTALYSEGMKKAFLSVCLLAAVAGAAPRQLELSPNNARVEFSIGHLGGVNLVRGHFDQFSGTLLYVPENPAASRVEWKVKTDSITTFNRSRDKHLLSADYLDSARFPEITFKSSSVQRADERTLSVTGNLTLHGVSRELTVPVTAGESGFFDSKFSIRRSDYGMQPDVFLASDETELQLRVFPAAPQP